MNFFEHQRLAKKKTKFLITYFVLAVLCIIGALFFVVSMLTGSSQFEPDVFYMTALATVIVITGGSLYKIARLRSGGHVVAEALGGRRISQDTNDAAERKTLNVVEEIAIASGMPVPPVYLLDESGINAFAAGYTHENAVIGVTRGCIDLLTRDELQGVIAHEFSHILHGDMRLNIRLMGILNGILIIGMTGYFILRSSLYSRNSYRSSNDSRNRAGFLLLGVALYAIGYIGVFFGRLIKAAISRQREFLADASAVQYTRNPDGISGALKKIGGFSSGSRVRHPHAEEASHMFFSPALSFFFNLMATHPPLLERIKKIEPRFSGDFPEVHMPEGHSQILGFTGSQSTFLDSSHLLTPENISQEVGKISSLSIRKAGEIIESLPAGVKDACKSAEMAPLVLYALLLSRLPQVREEQMNMLRQQKVDVSQIKNIHDELQDLPELYLLPIIDLSIPALKSLQDEQYDTIRRTVQLLAGADKELSLFEYMLYHILRRHIENPAAGVSRELSLNEFYKSALIILHCAADVGSPEPHIKDRALNAASDILYRGAITSHLTTTEYSIDDLDSALTELRRASYAQKELLLQAMVKAIAEDGRIEADEFHILRLVCDSLGCPMPITAGQENI